MHSSNVYHTLPSSTSPCQWENFARLPNGCSVLEAEDPSFRLDNYQTV